MLTQSGIQVLSVLIGYLMGAIPSGLLLTKIAGIGDVRNIGSGNIGATNVLRTGRKDLAFFTLLIDMAKGALPVIIFRELYGPIAGATAGLAAFVGHIFPIWLGFKGGKGVATFLGVLLALSPAVGLATAGTWLLVAKMSKLSSLAALIAAGLSPLYVSMIGLGKATTLIVAAMTLVIFYRHEQNIHRLCTGEEPKIGDKKDAPTDDAADIETDKSS